MLRLSAVKNIYDTYTTHKKTGNWAKWAQENPQGQKIFENVERLRTEHG